MFAKIRWALCGVCCGTAMQRWGVLGMGLSLWLVSSDQLRGMPGQTWGLENATKVREFATSGRSWAVFGSRALDVKSSKRWMRVKTSS